MTTRDQLREVIRACVDDPELFFRVVLRTPLRAWQRRACREISAKLKTGDRHIRVVVRSCHGAGKTFFAAGLALWWEATRPESRCLTTAPTWAGVENLLWPEIARAYNRSLLRDVGFGRLLTTHFEVTPTWYATGAASDKPENLEGHHSPTAALRIVDEAKAVEDGVFDATAGMLDAPETLDVWISTPSIRTGRFYSRDVSQDDAVIRVVVTVDDLIADGVEGKAAWKADRLKEWGETSPEYQSRALAQYVDDAEGALYPLSWIDRAMAADWDLEPDAPRVAGFDVAGSKDGDESVVANTAGPDSEDRYHVRSTHGWRDRDTMGSKGRAVMFADGAVLRVDCIGIGKGVHDSLSADGHETEEYRASDKPADDRRFANRKAEDSWRVRDLLENGKLRLPASPVLRSQMAAMRYEVMQTGKLRVLDPPDSPDHADAVVISLAGPGRGAEGGWLSVARAHKLSSHRAEVAA